MATPSSRVHSSRQSGTPRGGSSAGRHQQQQEGNSSRGHQSSNGSKISQLNFNRPAQSSTSMAWGEALPATSNSTAVHGDGKLPHDMFELLGGVNQRRKKHATYTETTKFHDNPIVPFLSTKTRNPLSFEIDPDHPPNRQEFNIVESMTIRKEKIATEIDLLRTLLSHRRAQATSIRPRTATTTYSSSKYN